MTIAFVTDSKMKQSTNKVQHSPLRSRRMPARWKTIGTAIVMFVAAATAASSGAPVNAAEPAGNDLRPLTITPSSGPVGTQVRVSGEGCAVDGQPILLAFAYGGPDSDDGIFMENIPVDEAGRFETNFEIPAISSHVVGTDSGIVLPGDFEFQTLPLTCIGVFTVTAPAAPTTAPAAPAAPVRGRPQFTG